MKATEVRRNKEGNDSAMDWINRIYHWFSMQTEKSEGKGITPETRFTEFPALSVDPRAGYLGLHRRPMIEFLFLPIF